MKYHCLFEQSGTFKNQFKKFGYEAYDYDILNDFGETDYQIDIFKEIESAYEGGESIFNNFKKEEDYLIAFFPCVRFEDQIVLYFKGNASQQKNKTKKELLLQDIELHTDLHRNYCLISKLVIICLDRGIPLIIENPKGTMHYLTRYWCLEPSLIDNDRTEMGDYYKKRTQYWFINCEPQNNLIFEAIPLKERKIVMKQNTVERSMISKDYANRFIREFILEKVEK